MSRVLDSRTLNRTTLQRQHLISRVAAPVGSVLDHLVGLQGQNPLDPYYGLWARVDGFDPAQLAEMVEDGRVQRGQLMRATIHLVTSGDWDGLRPISSRCATGLWAPPSSPGTLPGSGPNGSSTRPERSSPPSP